MNDWTDLPVSIEDFESWARGVGDYHALEALQRYHALRYREYQKVKASEKVRGVEE